MERYVWIDALGFIRGSG